MQERLRASALCQQWMSQLLGIPRLPTTFFFLKWATAFDGIQDAFFSPEKITLHSKFKNKPPSLGSSVTPITFGCKLQHFLKGKSRKVQHRHLETLIPAFVKFLGFTGVDLFSFKNDWNFCTNYSKNIVFLPPPYCLFVHFQFYWQFASYKITSNAVKILLFLF